MAKIELTLTIDGVEQDIPVSDSELTMTDIAQISGAVTQALLKELNRMHDEEAAELEAEAIAAEEAEAEAEDTPAP